MTLRVTYFVLLKNGRWLLCSLLGFWSQFLFKLSDWRWNFGKFTKSSATLVNQPWRSDQVRHILKVLQYDSLERNAPRTVWSQTWAQFGGGHGECFPPLFQTGGT